MGYNENLDFRIEYALSLTLSNLFTHECINKGLYEAYLNKYILKRLFLIQ